MYPIDVSLFTPIRKNDEFGHQIIISPYCNETLVDIIFEKLILSIIRCIPYN